MGILALWAQRFLHDQAQERTFGRCRVYECQALISILLDRNTEAALSPELVTAGSTEIGMGFVPISIRRQAVNRNPVPGIARRAVLLEGAGNLVWIVAHRSSPPFQAAE
jgi:hypothetical protein